MVGMEASLKRAIGGLNPWLPFFAFVALFQFMRGALFDSIYFLVIVLTLVLDWKNWFPYQLPAKPKLNYRLLFGSFALFGLVLYFLPRRSPIEIALMIALFFVVLSLSWHKDSGPLPKATPQLTRAKWLWLALAIAISLWELFAYILSDVARDVSAFPTISVVMDPFMKSDFGRATFLGAWLLIGLALLRIPRQK